MARVREQGHPWLSKARAGLLPFVLLCLISCSPSPNTDNVLAGWDEERLLLLTSTGTSEGPWDPDQGHVLATSAETSSPVTLETTGLESGKLVLKDGTLHFDDRDKSYAVGKKVQTLTGRESFDYMYGLHASNTKNATMRLFNVGYGEDGGDYRSAAVIFADQEELDVSVPYFLQANGMCGDSVYALGSNWRPNEDPYGTPLDLLKITWDGGVEVLASREIGDNAESLLPELGCDDGTVVWLERSESASENVEAVSLVQWSPQGGREVRRLVGADGERVGEICAGGSWSTVVSGAMYWLCPEGSIMRAELDTGVVNVAVDFRGRMGGALPLAYNSADGFVVLVTDWDSGMGFLWFFDWDGSLVSESEFSGLATTISNSGEVLYDFIDLHHPPEHE